MDTKIDLTPTAKQVTQGLDLRGRHALVTGGASGIGKETVRALAGAGARVTLAVRNVQAGEETAAELRADTGNSGIDVLALDLMDSASIRACAAAYRASGQPLHLLINNAGIMACPLARNGDGLESQLQSNALGPLQLSLELADLLVAGAPSRLVMVSSSAHRFSRVNFDDINFEQREYDPMKAYGQSKTAMVLLAIALQARLGGRGVTCLSVHPGVIRTNLMRYMPDGAIEAVEARLAERNESMKTPEQGAATTVWAATAPALADQGGAYLEDCGIATPCASPADPKGVMPWAIDPDAAERLWAYAMRLPALATLAPAWADGGL